MAISAVGKLFKKSALSFYSKKKTNYQLTSLEIMMLFHNKDSASVTSVLCVAHTHTPLGAAGLDSPHPPQAKPLAPSSGDGERGTEKVPSALLRTKNTLKANQVFISVTTFES